jgi:hypothetical protein
VVSPFHFNCYEIVLPRVFASTVQYDIASDRNNLRIVVNNGFNFSAVPVVRKRLADGVRPEVPGHKRLEL